MKHHAARPASRILLLALLLAMAPAQAQRMSDQPHVHGVAYLKMAYEEAGFVLQFDAPMHALVGFEYTPRSDEEKATVMKLMDQFGKFADLFTVNASARCATAESELLADNGPDTKHADVIGLFRYRCENIVALKTIDVHLMAKYPAIERIEVLLPATNGSKTAVLKRGASTRLMVPP